MCVVVITTPLEPFIKSITHNSSWIIVQAFYVRLNNTKVASKSGHVALWVQKMNGLYKFMLKVGKSSFRTIESFLLRRPLELLEHKEYSNEDQSTSFQTVESRHLLINRKDQRKIAGWHTGPNGPSGTHFWWSNNTTMIHNKTDHFANGCLCDW